ncbi:MAG: DUF3748 domain-containing protein [Bryobacterales bacterium]|nr:DUF3748 domain-containing protein [Bryobacterales bacterium]
MRWIFLLALAAALFAQERQLTTAPRTHALDNNDNFSPDDRFLCYDTRETEIWKVDVRTGAETLLFGKGPKAVAASYNPTRDEVIFIHGPLSEPYFKSNRRGAIVAADGSVRFLDTRDVASPVTPAGAHRGGTHRHEYSLNGKRVGFTYDDQLLPTYGRTIGMVQDGKFAILVPVVPEAAAKPGDIVIAASDSWVGRDGGMRAFIGRVKEADGSFRNSLFVADVPAKVDMNSAFAGDTKRFPSPPRGVRVRRLTTTDVSGIARGSRDGKFIAYLATAPDNAKQVFVIPSAGGAARQLTTIAGGVQAGIRWHPSGKFVAVSTGQGIAVTQFATGKTVFLTKKGGDALVWSNDGKTLAFNRKVGENAQIFLVDFTGGEF